jgi:hypothetical protein
MIPDTRAVDMVSETYQRLGAKPEALLHHMEFVHYGEPNDKEIKGKYWSRSMDDSIIILSSAVDLLLLLQDLLYCLE